MTRHDHMLSALGVVHGAAFTVHQLQDLFFILDARDKLGVKHFDFKPEAWGPRDPIVYQEAEALREQGLLSIYQFESFWGGRVFLLTPEGLERADEILGTLDPKYVDFLRRTSKFVRELTFAQLVHAISEEFPEMRTPTVFFGPSPRVASAEDERQSDTNPADGIQGNA